MITYHMSPSGSGQILQLDLEIREDILEALEHATIADENGPQTSLIMPDSQHMKSLNCTSDTIRWQINLSFATNM